MGLMTLLIYAAAHAVVTVSPGLIIAVLIIRNLTGDTCGAAGFAAGVCLGEVVAVLAIFVGLGAWAAKSIIAQYC